MLNDEHPIQAITQAARKVMWDLPTSHLTHQDWLTLSREEMTLPRSVPHEYGVIVFLDSDPESILDHLAIWRERGLSHHFLAIYEMAARDPLAPILINFDHDAVGIPGLPYPAEEPE